MSKVTESGNTSSWFFRMDSSLSNWLQKCLSCRLRRAVLSAGIFALRPLLFELFRNTNKFFWGGNVTRQKWRTNLTVLSPILLHPSLPPHNSYAPHLSCLTFFGIFLWVFGLDVSLKGKNRNQFRFDILLDLLFYYDLQVFS